MWALLSDSVSFKLLTTFSVLLLGGVAVWSFFNIYQAQRNSKPATGKSTSGLQQFNEGVFANNDNDEEEDSDDDNVTSQTMFDPSTDNAMLFGKTDKYEWNQNESEVEVFVGLNALNNSGDIKVKNINVTLKAQSLKIVVSGVTILNGEFFAKVIADECSWQLDTNSKGEKVIWMTIYKATPTVRNQHWKCVLKGDAEIKVGHLGPPVHGVDPSDPDAVKKAIQQIKDLSG